jgi:limonene-1,2-epoxide hydrolase
MLRDIRVTHAARQNNPDAGTSTAQTGNAHQEMPMTPAETVNAFIAAVERRDLDAALELVSDDCEYDNVPMAKVHGRDAMRQVLAPMVASATEIEWVVHRSASEGHLVLNERLDRFEMPFGWLEVAVAGVWEVHDGRITLWRDYFDEASYRRQLPTPG